MSDHQQIRLSAARGCGRRYLEEFRSHPTPISADVFARATLAPDIPFAWVKNPGWRGLVPGHQTIAVTNRTYALLVAGATLALRDAGVEKGDWVCLLGSNSLRWAVLHRAIQALGAVCVPIHILGRAADVAGTINDAQPKLTLCDSQSTLADKIDRGLIHSRYQNIRLFADLLESSRFGCCDYMTAGRQRMRAAAPPAVQQEFRRLVGLFNRDWRQEDRFQHFSMHDICLAIYTSGQSGDPKAVLHTHSTLAAGSAMVMDHGFALTGDDLVLHFLPLSHIFALGNAGLATCERYGIQCAFSPARELSESLRLFRPTVLAGVPAAWELILQGLTRHRLVNWATDQILAAPASPCRAARLILSVARRVGGLERLRLAITGGAAADRDVLSRLAAAGLKVCPGYGSSEAQATFCNLPDANDPRSIGLRLPGVLYSIREPGAGFNMPPDKVAGTLWLKGRHLFVGYRRDGAIDRRAFDQFGYFDTGDLVEELADGSMRFLGREKGRKKLSNAQFYVEEEIQAAIENAQAELGCAGLASTLVVGENRPYPTVLFFLRPQKAQIYFEAPPLGSDPQAFFAAHAGVQATLKQVVERANRALSATNKMQVVRGWLTVPESPSFDNGLLGPTGKHSLSGALKRYGAQIEKLYE